MRALIKITMLKLALRKILFKIISHAHYQIDKPQAKLVSVTQGEVFDVVVDIRKNSPTYGKWFGEYLNDQNHYQLYIPEGFAHGFCVISDTADFMYKCTDYYYPQGERGLRFDDPAVNIQWPIDTAKAILAEKDKLYPDLIL
jgi:dTDP-4-dehydrorhamnose 3,5-epimerase